MARSIRWVSRLDTSIGISLAYYVPSPPLPSPSHQVVDVSGAGTIYSSSAYKALEAGTDAPRAMVGLLTCTHATVATGCM